VTVFTNLIDCDLDALAVGQAVHVAFDKKPDGLTVPVFRPA
jgi:hypothetical protein